MKFYEIKRIVLVIIILVVVSTIVFGVKKISETNMSSLIRPAINSEKIPYTSPQSNKILPVAQSEIKPIPPCSIENIIIHSDDVKNIRHKDGKSFLEILALLDVKIEINNELSEDAVYQYQEYVFY